MRFKQFLNEFDDTKLAYHETLNPKLWEQGPGEPRLLHEVKTRLLLVGQKFGESLGLPPGAIKDVVLTGSNANYNWTSLSDVDVHLMVDVAKMREACQDCVLDVRDCLDAKKSLWNDRHDIEIYGHPVEVYASDADDRGVGDAGVYSLVHERWLKLPERRQVDIGNPAIKAKAGELASEIDSIVDSGTNDEGVINELVDRLWRMRQAGLEQSGEFSVENLVFKALRNNGYVDKIRNYVVNAQDSELSLK